MDEPEKMLETSHEEAITLQVSSKYGMLNWV